MTLMLSTVPFPGFYESSLSREIDCQAEQFAEYEEENRQAEDGIPEYLRLTASEICEILFDVTRHRIAYEQIAKDYAEAFAAIVDERLEFESGIVFESMTSPKYYNFESDRLFVEIPQSTVEKMFALSADTGHETLKQALRDRFTSYDGFSSHYSNDLDDWLSKPLADWDHNEVGALLVAVAFAEDGLNDLDYEIYEHLTYSDCAFYSAWSDSVDWPAYEERVQELRDEKLKEWLEENPGEEPPYRCTLTPDLFEARA